MDFLFLDNLFGLLGMVVIASYLTISFRGFTHVFTFLAVYQNRYPWLPLLQVAVSNLYLACLFYYFTFYRIDDPGRNLKAALLMAGGLCFGVFCAKAHQAYASWKRPQ